MPEEQGKNRDWSINCCSPVEQKAWAGTDWLKQEISEKFRELLYWSQQSWNKTTFALQQVKVQSSKPRTAGHSDHWTYQLPHLPDLLLLLSVPHHLFILFMGEVPSSCHPLHEPVEIFAFPTGTSFLQIFCASLHDRNSFLNICSLPLLNTGSRAT